MTNDQNFDEDILQPISDGNLEHMEAICRQNLPRTIRSHHFLYNFNAWKRRIKAGEDELSSKITSDKCLLTFYGHRNGVINNCTYFAISGEKDYSIFGFSLEISRDEFRECLEKTKRIKWNLGPLIVSMEDQHREVFHKVIPIEPVAAYPNNIYWLPKQKALEFDIELPEHVGIRPLTYMDGKLISNEWPRNYPGSLEYIINMININGGLGIYSKKDEKLLSWVAINDNFCPGFLQTIPTAKRKGYASLVMKAISKKIALEYGLDILAFVMHINDPSNGLMKQLGFKIVGSCAWMHMPTGKIC